MKEIKLAEKRITLGRPTAGFLRAFGFLTHCPFSVTEPPAVLVHERACCGKPGLKQPLPALNKGTMRGEAWDRGTFCLDPTPDAALTPCNSCPQPCALPSPFRPLHRGQLSWLPTEASIVPHIHSCVPFSVLCVRDRSALHSLCAARRPLYPNYAKIPAVTCLFPFNTLCTGT